MLNIVQDIRNDFINEAKNSPTLLSDLAHMEKYISDPLGSECYSENTSDDDMSEYTFTGLRKAEGIFYDRFSEKFSKNFWEHFGEKAHNDFTEFVKTGHALETPDGIRLTKKGFSISNRIMNIFV